jgi:hypothetical protein
MRKNLLIATALVMALGNTIDAKGELKKESAFPAYEGNTAVEVAEIRAAEKVKVIFSAEEKKRVEVRILDENQKLVYSTIIKKKSFIQPFDLSYLPEGYYTIEVITDEDVVTRPIYHVKKKARIEVNPEGENGRFKLTAKGIFKENITVFILDKDNNLVYEDVIKEKTNFDRVYDLSHVNVSELKFNVFGNDINFSKTLKK